MMFAVKWSEWLSVSRYLTSRSTYIPLYIYIHRLGDLHPRLYDSNQMHAQVRKSSQKQKLILTQSGQDNKNMQNNPSPLDNMLFRRLTTINRMYNIHENKENQPLTQINRPWLKAKAYRKLSLNLIHQTLYKLHEWVCTIIIHNTALNTMLTIFSS